GESGGENFPGTFAEGIPPSYFRPRRALLMWSEWVTNAYPPALLLEMLRNGVLGGKKGKGSFAGPGHFLQQNPHRFGRRRYLEKVAHYRRHLEDQGQAQKAQLDDEGNERRSPEEYLKRRLQALKVIAELCSALLNSSSISMTGPLEILEKAKQFLGTLARK